ncbi:hypothetical protein RCL1_001725 [Eukaryota sp. TZLM3-RCL]
MSLRDFQSFIKSVADARFKQDEERVMKAEILTLRKYAAGSDMNAKKAAELILRIAYAEMLGYDASFGHIYAVNLTQSESVLHKRLGYLVCSLCLHPDHDLLVLLVNSIQRDLRSRDHIVVSIALGAASRLLNAEMIPAVLDQVVSLAEHHVPLVRKKALATLHAFLLRSPLSIHPHVKLFSASLIDKSPSVISVAVSGLCSLTKDSPDLYQGTIPSLIGLLRQISDGLFPVGYTYRKFPHPWLQTHVLRCMTHLCQDNPETAETIAGVVREVLTKRDVSSNIGTSITFEAVRTASSILGNFEDLAFPSDSLSNLYAATAETVATFMQAEQPNMKYLGVQLLTTLIGKTPSIALHHQRVVLNCLDDSDETIRRITLTLMGKMCNNQNVSLIIDRFMTYLIDYGAVDHKLLSSLVPIIVSLAEKFTPNIEWYVDTIVKLYCAADGLVPDHVSLNLIDVLSSTEVDTQSKSRIVETFLNLSINSIPFTLVQLLTFVLGSYSSHNQVQQSIKMIELLLRHVLDCNTSSSLLSIKSIIVISTIQSVLKLLSVHSFSFTITSFKELVTDIATGVYSSKINVTAKHSALEFVRLVGPLSNLIDFYNQEGSLSAFDVVVDSISDGHSKSGAVPYISIDQRRLLAQKSKSDDMSPRDFDTSKLKFDAYIEPKQQISSSQLTPSPVSLEPAVEVAVKVVSTGTKKWGSKGIIKQEEKKEVTVEVKNENKPFDGVSSGVSSSSRHPSINFDRPRQSTPVVVDHSRPEPLSEEKQNLANALFGSIQKKPAASVTNQNLIDFTSSDVSSVKNNQSKVDEFDFLGDFGAISTTSNQTPNQSNDIDLFSDLMDVAVQPKSTINTKTVIKLPFLIANQIFTEGITYERVPIISNTSFDVSFVAVKNNQKSGLVVYFTNLSEKTIKSPALSGIKFETIVDSTTRVTASSFGNKKIAFSDLSPCSTSAVFLYISSWSLFSQVATSSLQFMYENQSINFDISLPLDLFITKFKINTREYANYWKSIQTNQKAVINFPDPNPRSWLSHLESCTGITSIDISGQEGISSVKLIGCGEEVCAFVHAKIGGGKCAFTVKSQNPVVVGLLCSFISNKCS